MPNYEIGYATGDPDSDIAETGIATIEAPDKQHAVDALGRQVGTDGQNIEGIRWVQEVRPVETWETGGH